MTRMTAIILSNNQPDFTTMMVGRNPDGFIFTQVCLCDEGGGPIRGLFTYTTEETDVEKGIEATEKLIAEVIETVNN